MNAIDENKFEVITTADQAALLSQVMLFTESTSLAAFISTEDVPTELSHT